MDIVKQEYSVNKDEVKKKNQFTNSNQKHSTGTFKKQNITNLTQKASTQLWHYIGGRDNYFQTFILTKLGCKGGVISKINSENSFTDIWR